MLVKLLFDFLLGKGILRNVLAMKESHRALLVFGTTFDCNWLRFFWYMGSVTPRSVEYQFFFLRTKKYTPQHESAQRSCRLGLILFSEIKIKNIDYNKFNSRLQ